jgi:hypothetical protein
MSVAAIATMQAVLTESVTDLIAGSPWFRSILRTVLATASAFVPAWYAAGPEITKPYSSLQFSGGHPIVQQFGEGAKQ